MNVRRYLLDNNALTKLTRAQRSSAFLRQHCRITSEVLYEATGLSDHLVLGELEYRTTVEVLELLRVVMATVPPADFKLVDLYSNKGAADPGLIAAALHATRVESERLFQDEWLIVTDDQAVARTALQHGIVTMTAAAFSELVEQNER